MGYRVLHLPNCNKFFSSRALGLTELWSLRDVNCVILASSPLDIFLPFFRDQVGLIRRTEDAPQFTIPFTPMLQADIVAEKTVNVTEWGFSAEGGTGSHSGPVKFFDLKIACRS